MECDARAHTHTSKWANGDTQILETRLIRINENIVNVCIEMKSKKQQQQNPQQNPTNCNPQWAACSIKCCNFACRTIRWWGIKDYINSRVSTGTRVLGDELSFARFESITWTRVPVQWMPLIAFRNFTNKILYHDTLPCVYFIIKLKYTIKD